MHLRTSPRDAIRSMFKLLPEEVAASIPVAAHLLFIRTIRLRKQKENPENCRESEFQSSGVLKLFDTATPFSDLVFRRPSMFKNKQNDNKPQTDKYSTRSLEFFKNKRKWYNSPIL